MNAPEGHSGLRSSAEQLLDDVDTLLGLSGGRVIADFRTALRRPAVIAVTGRVNTGKSTLVNSLISAKLAPTSTQETTALLCRYVYGSPARAEAVLDTGNVVPVPLTGSGPVLEDIPPETIDYLQVHVQAAVLRPATIVDTPGLGSAATDNSRRTEARMLGGTDPDSPDALLYLVRDSFRPDDEEFIARFKARPGAGPGRSTVVGLVAHADNFGGGPWHGAEPVDQAQTAAAELSGRMPQLTAVLPVSALLAETVQTGALREQDVRNLRLLQGADDLRLQFADQLGAPPEVSGEDFLRLTGLIGPYGIRYGREQCGSAGQLTRWLHERSGLAALERTLQSAVIGPTESARVDGMLTGLLAAARSRSWPADARRLIEAARHAPAFHRLHEEAALDLLKADAPGHEMVAVLQGLTRDDPELDGVLPDISGSSGYLGLAAHYQSMVSTASTGAEARAARVIARSLLIRSGTAGSRP
ncbi:GTPase [Pseudarthrobacter sp. ATCC 49987]|uniref:GTPase n=1 Tax=Pseudarthrobacter sp. ATCC 49987 TaxID=2698204 RepID=UPI001371749A|nr:GTPase [Pseudarthrobacter sp. ATCC 49987]